MSAQHTPGPWATNPRGLESEAGLVFASTLASGARRLVASAVVGRECEANARLIAAAPALLEALKLAVRQNEHDMLLTGEELRQCSAAIAAARGQA